MDLAEWCVDPGHPLTAGVAVNRFWQQFFGTGLVKTSEDLGTQGEVPVYPELLDLLAVSFVESGWDVKALVRQIVMSRTYRQSSTSTPDQFAADPENQLLARGSRFRMDAEMIRDQILATSGLLVHTMYGTQDAAARWEYHYVGTMLNAGFTRGIAYPAIFRHREQYLRVLVHGDDFVGLGGDEGSNFLDQKLKEVYD